MITAATLGLFSFYYNASADDYLKILVVTLVLVALAVAITLVRTLPLIRPIQDWIDGARDEEPTREGVGGGGRPAAGADPPRHLRSRSASRSSRRRSGR